MIYFIGTDWDSPVKIGLAKDPKSRLKQLQTGNPSRLKILDTYQPIGVDDALVEKEMHRSISDYRMNGEWFYGPAALAINKRKGDFKSRMRFRFVHKNKIKKSYELEIEKLNAEIIGYKKTCMELRDAVVYYLKRLNCDRLNTANKLSEKRWLKSIS